MAKVLSEKQVNSFIKGLITEASPLTFPENASLDEDNFVLRRDGSRSRRLGLEYEIDYAITPTGLSEALIRGSRQSFHSWAFPSGDTGVSMGVVRVYNTLWFMDLLSPNPSATLLNQGNSLTISGLANADLETTVINNYLVMVSKDLPYPILLSYNATTDVVSQEQLLIQVRDVWGVADGLDIDERPASITDLHRYNLKNQGWSTKVTSTCGTDAIDCTFTTVSKYPSNADIWTLGKVGDSTSVNFEKYDPNKLVLNSIDNSFVSRGSYILDVFNRGADRAALTSLTLPLDQESGTFSTVCSYAGRVFYSGIASNITSGDDNSPNYSGYIFFTQIASSKERLNKCYQEADPTSPNISDIIDTDGGTIQIPEATKIVKIISARSSLIVFAENGVWEVYGDTGGFVATSFQLSRVSNIGISNQKAVVDANGTLIYFSKAGIYALVQDPASGRFGAQSLSLTTIQSFYNTLPEEAKNHAKGFFDEKENRVRWLYNDEDNYTESNYINRYNRELILDLTLQAFYPHSFSVLNKPYVCDYIELPGYASATIEEEVYAGNDQVFAGSDEVYVPTAVTVNRVAQFDFLAMVDTGFTVAKYRNGGFLDWETYDGFGTDYSSYLLTGYEIKGDLMRNKQVPYILFYFERTEDGFDENLNALHPSGCLVQSQWNWTDSVNSGKWGTQFQAYRLRRPYIPQSADDIFTYGERVVVTKNKLRGSGRALSLLIESEAGKDMRLLGWAMIITGVSNP